MLHEVTPRVGMKWQPWDIDQVSWRGVTLMARFLTEYCCLWRFSISWDQLRSLSYPLCGGGLFLGASIVGLHNNELVEAGISEPWVSGMGGGFRAFFTFGIGPFEPVPFGYLASLADAECGGSFW